MASPQKENGYTAIANEILDHLAQPGINGSEYRILMYVFRKTYGFQKTQDCIPLSQFQKGTLMSRSHVVEVIKSLVHKRILLKEKNVYRFNKNWEQWLVHKRVPQYTNVVQGSTQKQYKSSTQKQTLKRKKETISKESIATTSVAEWNFKEALKKMDESPRRDINIISLYWKNKDPKLTNKKQAEIELRRCLRAAGLLMPYEDDRLVDTMEWLKKNADFKWTLESVLKYITEDLSKLKAIR